MLRPFALWDETFRKLGFVRRKRSRPVRDRRLLRMEKLETRDLLTTVSFVTPPTSVVEGNNVSISLLRDSYQGSLTVQISTSGSSAGAGDYTLSPSSSVTFNAGASTATMTLSATSDSNANENESVNLVIQSSGNYTIGSPGTASVQIMDAGGGGGPGVTVSATDSSAAEPTTDTGTFRITRPTPGSEAVTVYYSMTGTATAGADYSSLSGSAVIPAGVTYVDVAVSPLDDNVDEATETIILTLSSASGGLTIGSPASATVNVTDDDPTPALSIADLVVSEADNTAHFTVTLSNPSSSTITVQYSTANGTATGGNGSSGDFTSATSATFTIPPNTTSKDLDITLRVDTQDETDETFYVNLANPSGATLADNQALGTIDDNDGPNITISDPSVTEGGSLVFTVSLSATSPQDVLVQYASQDYTASASADYTAAALTTLTFLANGTTTKTITIPTAQDALDEDHEQLNVILTNAVDGQIADSSGTGTINDDDPLPSVALSPASTSVDESAGYVTYTVTLTPVSGRTVTVDYSTANGSAAAGSDYTATSGTLSFLPGVTVQSITVPITGDARDEFDETFTLSLSNPGNTVLGASTATTTILDDDPPPSLSVQNQVALESAGNLVFVVSLSQESGKTITVNYATATGTATSGDFTSQSGVLTFSPGTVSQNVSIPIASDSQDELDETLFLDLSSAVNATMSAGEGTGTIDDDDGPAISINDVSVGEAVGNASWTISLSATSLQDVSVHWATSGGTAVAGADYTSASGTVTIPAGSLSANLSVAILNDGTDENDETLTVTLDSPVDGTISDGIGSGIIQDDDPLPVLSINQASLDEIAGVMTFRVTLSPASGRQVSVQYGTSDVTTTSNTDYFNTSGTLTFEPGETEKDLLVTIKHDTVDETDEQFLMWLSVPVNATLDAEHHIGTGTIEDNDGPNVSIQGLSLEEGATTAALNVQLSAASPQTVRVHYQTAAGSAVAGSDYTTTSGILEFLPGTTLLQVGVPILADAQDEIDETLSVTLSQVEEGELLPAEATATVTILDNDGPWITISNPAVSEANGTITFQVQLSAASQQPITVNYTTEDGSADSPADYTPQGGTLTFPVGSQTQSIVISLVDDTQDEIDQAFLVRLSGEQDGYFQSPADRVGTGTILDNDGPAISIADGLAVEGAGSLSLVISLSAPSVQPVTVTYSTANGSATAGSDYTAVSGQTATIPAGQTSVNISIPLVSDNSDEENEQFVVNLSAPAGGTLADSQGSATINDDDEPPLLSVDSPSVLESGGPLVFTLTLSAASGKEISLHYATANGTASSGNDYTSASGTVTFAAGQTSKTVSVSLVNDFSAEQDETVLLNFTEPVQVQLPSSPGTGTILDNEPRLKIEALDAVAAETSGSANPATFRLTRTGDYSGGLTVYLAVTGTATQGADFGVISTIVTMTGSTLDLAINPVNDTLWEDVETVIVTLQSSAAYSIDQAHVSDLATIADNDHWLVKLETEVADAYEVGGTVGRWKLSRSGETDLSQPLQVSYQLATSSTATPYVDYEQLTAADFIIPAGATYVNVDVAPVEDATAESSGETVAVTLLEDASHYQLETPLSGQITIHDGALYYPPTITPPGNLTLDEDAPEQLILLTGISAGGGVGDVGQTLSLTATAADPQLITGLQLDYVSAQSTGYLRFTPGLNQHGQSHITLTLTDSGGMATSVTLGVTLTSVNDAPTAWLDEVHVAEDSVTGLVLAGADVEGDALQYRLLALPAHGALSYLENGPAITAVGVLSSAQLFYRPDSGYFGPDELEFQAEEVSSLVSSPVVPGVIVVGGVNDPPVITSPATVTTLEDTPFVFSGGILTVGDPDAGDKLLQLILTAEHGLLSLGDFPELVDVPHAGVESIRFKASATQANVILATLSFLPALNYVGAAAKVKLLVNDQGNTGSGGAKADEATILIAITPVNDAPVNTLPAGPIFASYLQSTALAGFSVSDVDHGSLAEEVILDLTAGTLSVPGVAASDPLSLVDLVPIINGKLAGLMFIPPAGAVAGSSMTLTMTTDDRGNTGAGGAKTDIDSVLIVLHDKPVVGIEAVDPDAYEANLDPGKFRIYRTYPASPDPRLDQSLSVEYIVRLDIPNFADPGLDYAQFAGTNWQVDPLTGTRSLRGTVQIPAGQSQVFLDVNPFQDRLLEPDEYVQVDLVQPAPTLSSGAPGGYAPPPYFVQSGYGTAIVTIHDAPPTGSPPVVGFSPTDAFGAEIHPGEIADNLELTFTRGEENVGAELKVYFKVNAPASSSAPPINPDTQANEGTDFTISGAVKRDSNPDVWEVTIAAGKASAVVRLDPINDAVIEWDETIRIELAQLNPLTQEPVTYLVQGSASTSLTLYDNDGFGGLMSRNLDRDSTSLSRDGVGNGTISVDIYEGQVVLGVGLPGAVGPIYRGDDNLHPLLPVEWELPAIGVGSQAVPTSLRATANFAGHLGESTSFAISAGVNPAAGQLRYVVPTSGEIKDQLKTGHYDYHLQFDVSFAGDDQPRIRTIRGSTQIVNTTSDQLGSAELGAGWRVSELDRLTPSDGLTAPHTDQGLAALAGQAIIRGDNTAGFFPSTITDKTIKSDPQFDNVLEWHDGTFESSQPYKYTSSGDRSKWTFSDLTADQQYQVYVSWTPGLTRTSAANYVVQGHPIGSDDDSASIIVDQRFTPGETLESNQYWRSLGYFTAKDDQILVQLTGSGGETVAQSVMLVEEWSFPTGPEGSFSQLVYEDSSAADAKRFILKDKFGGQAEFNDQGLLQRREDRNQNVTQYAYLNANQDGLANELQTIKRQGDLTTTFRYTAAGYLDQITDFAGRETNYVITSGKLSQIKLPVPGQGNDKRPTWELGYGSPEGQLDFVQDPNTNNTTLTYGDKSHRVQSVTNADGNFWKIAPFLVDGLATGAGSGQAAPIRKPAGEDALIGQNEIAAQLAADALRQPRATYTDPRSGKWDYQADAFGLTLALAKPPTLAIPTADVWQWKRRSDGLPSEAILPAGGGGSVPINQKLTTKFDQYDSKGNLRHVEYADGTTASWEYNAQFAVVTKATDQLQRDTEFGLDSRGNVEYVRTMQGGSAVRTLRTQYTAAPTELADLPGGLPTQITVAEGSPDAVSSLTEYYTSGAKVGLVKKVTQAYGTSVAQATGYDYDARRNPATTTDALLHVTTSQYDDLNRLLQVTYPAPGTGTHPAPVASFQYDALGLLRESRDVRGVVTKTRYDALNRVEYVEAPRNGGSVDSIQTEQITQNVYDQAGNLQEVKYPKGTGGDPLSAHFEYDARNQQIKTTLPAPGVSLPEGMTVPLAGAPITHFAYDVLGNLKSASDPRSASIVTTYGYDSLQRRVSVTNPATEDHGATTTINHFDLAGRLESVDYPGPNGMETIAYTYDRLDRLIFTLPPADAQGNYASVYTTYDLRDNVLAVANALGQTTTTTYDLRNRPTEIRSPDPLNGHGRILTTNVFDVTGRLTSNTTQEEGNASSALTTTYTLDALNRVTDTYSPDPDGAGPNSPVHTSHQFDSAGNAISTRIFAGGTPQHISREFDNYGRAWHVLGTEVNGVRPETVSLFDLRGALTDFSERTGTALGAATWRTWSYVVDNLGRLFASAEPADGEGNRPTQYQVSDEAGNVVAARDALGHVSQMTFDALSRVKSIIAPTVAGENQPPVTTVSYNQAGLAASITDALGRVTSHVFDQVGNLMQTIMPAINGVSPHLDYGYDVLGNLTSSTDVEGNTTRYLRDGLSRVTQTLYPAERSLASGGGGSEVYLVDDGDGGFSTTGVWATHQPAAGAFQDDYRGTSDAAATATYTFTVQPGKRYLVLATWQADAGAATGVHYNWLDGAVSEGGAVISQRLVPDDYSADGRMWEILGGVEVATQGTGNLRVIQTAGGPATADAIRLIQLGPSDSVAYDGLGRMVSQTNELGQTTTYQYDAVGNQTRVTLPDSDGNGPQEAAFTATTYNGWGLPLATTNSLGETTQFGYDSRGLRTSITDPTGQVTHLGYDLLGRNTGVQDPSGNVTNFGYDNLDRKVWETQLLVGGGSATRSFGYDLLGNKTLSVDRLGRATVYQYDERNQLRSENWFANVSDAAAGLNQLGEIAYVYDPAGRLASAGSYTYSLDGLDRVVSEGVGHIPGGMMLTTSFGDRLDGLRQSLGATISGVADFVNQYAYDARLQMTQVTQSGVTGGHTVAPKRVDLVHADDGRLESLARYADLAGTHGVAQTNFSYDGQNRVTGINHFKGNTTLAQYGYSHDAAGRIVGMSSPDGAVAYAYNDRGELTGADYSGTNQPSDATYSYDANGNRTGAGFTTGGHNTPLTDGIYSYQYDAEGNRIRRTETASGNYDDYSWDNRNRLTQVAHRAANDTLLWTVDYQYDYQNRMIERVETLAGQSPTTERFVYDGSQIILRTDAAGGVTHRYLWGEAVDQILADETVDLVLGVSTTRWTLTDHQNTVRDLVSYESATDQTSIVDHIIYEAFGKAISESSPTNSTSLKFTGRYTDPLTGLQWNLNRWYDSSLHQWLSIDPILFEAGDPNPRRYVGNDPVNRVDPSGLEELPATRSPIDDWYELSNQPGVFEENDYLVRELARSKKQIAYYAFGSREEVKSLGVTKLALNEYDKQRTAYGVRDFQGALRAMGMDGEDWVVTSHAMKLADVWVPYLEIRNQRTDEEWYAVADQKLTYKNGYFPDSRSEWLPAIPIIGGMIARRYVEPQGEKIIGVEFYRKFSDVEWNMSGMDRMEAMQTLATNTWGMGLGNAASATTSAGPRLGKLMSQADNVRVPLTANLDDLARQMDGVNAPNSNSPYALFNKTHAGSQPVPKGLGPNGGRLQSHHGLQQEWAANNLPGYDPKLAPTVTIETGKGFPHTTLSNLQNARRDARVAAGFGKWGSSIDDELGFIVSDFRQAGYGDDVVKQVLEQNYRMLDKLGIKYSKPAGF